MIEMRSLRLILTLAVILVTVPMASVFAAGYQVSTPIIGTTGAPALAPGLSAPANFAGLMSVLYADGTPVFLSSNQATLDLCSTSSCVLVTATLTQSSPGSYSYSFTPPSSITGTVTIYIQAGSLADDNGRIFPSVDTQIGTYAAGTQPTSGLPATRPILPANPNVPNSVPEQLTRQAVEAAQPRQESPVLPVVLALIVLALVAVGLLILPARRK